MRQGQGQETRSGGRLESDGGQKGSWRATRGASSSQSQLTSYHGFCPHENTEQGASGTSAETVPRRVGGGGRGQPYPAAEQWNRQAQAGVRCSVQAATTGLARWKEEESTGTRASGSRSSGNTETWEVKFRGELGESERKQRCIYLGTRRYGKVGKGMWRVSASSQCVGGLRARARGAEVGR